MSDSKSGIIKHFNGKGFIHGAFLGGKLRSYSKVGFPGYESVNVKEIGLCEAEMTRLAYYNGTVGFNKYRGYNYQKAEKIFKLHNL